MRLRSLLPALLLGLLAVMSPARLSLADDANDKAVFTQLYAEMRDVMDRRDRAEIKALFDADFVSIDMTDSRQTADQVIDALVAMPPNATAQRQTDVLAVSIDGDTATVRQRYHAAFSGKDNQGKPLPIEVDTVSTDIWSRKGEAWHIRQTRTDEMKVTRDGKVVLDFARPQP